MAGDSDPSEERLESLGPEERRVLAALAVVGDASLSAGELAALVEVAAAEPVVAELVRRGLVRSEEPGRYVLAPGLGERIRRTWDVVDAADRLLRQLISIAEDGRLTPSDLDAVLAVAEWAAGVGRLEELLQLVRATETALDVERRVEAWIEILRRAQVAAREVGDRGAEVWTAEQLQRCTAAVGVPPPAEVAVRPLRSTALRVAALVVTAVVGLGVGVAVGRSGAPSETTTETVPGETVVSTETETSTQTETTTETEISTQTETTTETSTITETVTTTETVTETVIG